MSSAEAIVFDVQRFSVHDGPGIRTVVFFKGCSLRCAWCQNPEALATPPELAYYEDRCLEGCDACVSACPRGALKPQRSERVSFEACDACGECVGPCPADALRIVGQRMDAAALLEAVLRDRSFYGASGGGVTLSGGEPVLQHRLLAELLPRAKAAGLHVALETAGRYPFPFLEPLLPHLDLVLYDLKVIDAAAHERLTGFDNSAVLGNLAELVARGVPVTVRMPVIPGMTDRAENVDAVARHLLGLGVGELTLLRYNGLWEAKLPRLATAAKPLGLAQPEDGYYVDLAAAFAARGVTARL